MKSAIGQSARGQSLTDCLPKYGTNAEEKPGSLAGFVTRHRLSPLPMNRSLAQLNRVRQNGEDGQNPARVRPQGGGEIIGIDWPVNDRFTGRVPDYAEWIRGVTLGRGWESRLLGIIEGRTGMPEVRRLV